MDPPEGGDGVKTASSTGVAVASFERGGWRSPGRDRQLAGAYPGGGGGSSVAVMVTVAVASAVCPVVSVTVTVAV